LKPVCSLMVVLGPTNSNTVNLLGDHLFFGDTNECDLNMYSPFHINPYKIVTIGKKTLQNNLFMLE